MPHAEGNPDSKGLAKFRVQSTDVLSDMRINVFEEGTENVVWYKERFLGDEEIIENIVENATSTILWTIHRPAQHGWYIRIRASTFPPGVFISLTPPQKSSPFYTDAALTFACRTSAPPAYSIQPNHLASGSKRSLDSDITLTDMQRDYSGSSLNHSYPPTPPQTGSPRLYSLSPRALDISRSGSNQLPPLTALSNSGGSKRRSTQFVNGQITQFMLTPHSTHAPSPHNPPTTNPSLFTRVVSALKSHAPVHSSSFTLSALPPRGLADLGPATTANASANTATPSSRSTEGTTPILTFHDKTPVWTVRSNYGLIELDTEQVRMLGVEMSFYVACALTYLEYLGERESYLAAAAD